MNIRHVILDRDGVLNHEAPGSSWIQHPDEFHWLSGALDGLKMLRDAGIRISIATNQSGVGRGVMTPSQLSLVHERMRTTARASGVELDGVFCCTHAPDAGCACRKPAPGLIEAAIGNSGIDAADTVAVGDSSSDLEAAGRAGIRAILLRTGKGSRTEALAAGLGVAVYDDLPALAKSIVAGELQHVPLRIEEIFAEHATVLSEALQASSMMLERVAFAGLHCLRGGGKVFACGNGGSAADAQHLVAELVGRFRNERRALPAVALTGDVATLTAVANDYGYERVFARQLEGLARAGDVLFALSTSGNSPNVVEAARTARRLGCIVVALSGAQGGLLAEHATLSLRVPSGIVARVQEGHQLFIHVIVDLLDELLARGGRS